ncbi:hypothetical protein GCM10009555_047320 [Acrocarpospora macrocephala]|uniref:HTH arsR-type domain-containing protein n=1 Tax=Acrocarpospora macrocephala TaxID=150177 RepID=A0A5M3WT59_9ACTN|nr:winged helix-turn-helix domain-containing protein [Acrocarpospora macrocephala]GES12074.1 hypothetical protein Amac_056710 [Acrocarpospora macrocephala]
MLRIHFTAEDIARTRLATAPRAGHHDDLIRASVEADVAARVGALLAGGVEALLRGFEPLMRWRAPVLEVRYPVERDLHLQGRGLRLVPSFCCGATPLPLVEQDLPPVLVYPIAPEHRRDAITDPGDSLADLMGGTRAAVLAALRDSASTTQLATRLHTSLAAMSRHTKTLRQAGLITTTRCGPAVLHDLTPLGRRLLDGPLCVTAQRSSPSQGADRLLRLCDSHDQ